MWQPYFGRTLTFQSSGVTLKTRGPDSPEALT